MTVLVEDINDNKPQFVGAPYRIRVEELTPPGLTVFRGLQALDRDKPNTANSEVTYSIIGGNEQRKFSVEATSSKKAVVVLRKDLDYDKGDKTFNLTIKAEVRHFRLHVKYKCRDLKGNLKSFWMVFWKHPFSQAFHSSM